MQNQGEKEWSIKLSLWKAERARCRRQCRRMKCLGKPWIWESLSGYLKQSSRAVGVCQPQFIHCFFLLLAPVGHNCIERSTSQSGVHPRAQTLLGSHICSISAQQGLPGRGSVTSILRCAYRGGSNTAQLYSYTHLPACHGMISGVHSSSASIYACIDVSRLNGPRAAHLLLGFSDQWGSCWVKAREERGESDSAPQSAWLLVTQTASECPVSSSRKPSFLVFFFFFFLLPSSPHPLKRRPQILWLPDILCLSLLQSAMSL